MLTPNPCTFQQTIRDSRNNWQLLRCSTAARSWQTRIISSSHFSRSDATRFGNKAQQNIIIRNDIGRDRMFLLHDSRSYKRETVLSYGM
jgi:hypothetical protein